MNELEALIEMKYKRLSIRVRLYIKQKENIQKTFKISLILIGRKTELYDKVFAV